MRVVVVDVLVVVVVMVVAPRARQATIEALRGVGSAWTAVVDKLRSTPEERIHIFLLQGVPS